jgi:hypothetical protein
MVCLNRYVREHSDLLKWDRHHHQTLFMYATYPRFHKLYEAIQVLGLCHAIIATNINEYIS